ncbi:MAG TPA: class I SAM-dependent methyltransferase [Thermoanaerobaculia bacterium]
MTANTKERTDEQHRARYAEAIANARREGSAAFQNWFNQSGSVEESLVRGHWDFAAHILTPSVWALISEPHRKTSLEIGYGGGRIINAAANFFGRAVGVDVHGERDSVQQFLTSVGKQNVLLLDTDGRSLPVDDQSIDFVYSFIVLQHLPAFEVLESYVSETFRVLKKDGVAQLYFGRFGYAGRMARLRNFARGYVEIADAPVNFTSLVVTKRRMKRLCESHGFTVVDTGMSYKSIPDGYPHRKGMQHYVTLVKR